MSAERDLLRRAKCLLECSNMEPLQRQTDLIIGEIKDLLEQPKQEPFKPDWVNYRQGVEDAKREPLSVDKLAAMAVEDEFLLFCSEDEFIEIARVIEKAHGIGEQK